MPTPMALTTASAFGGPLCVSVVPSTATGPKNTNTATSPSPTYPYGLRPPV